MKRTCLIQYKQALAAVRRTIRQEKLGWYNDLIGNTAQLLEVGGVSLCEILEICTRMHWKGDAVIWMGLLIQLPCRVQKNVGTKVLNESGVAIVRDRLRIGHCNQSEQDTSYFRWTPYSSLRSLSGIRNSRTHAAQRDDMFKEVKRLGPRGVSVQVTMECEDRGRGRSILLGASCSEHPAPSSFTSTFFWFWTLWGAWAVNDTFEVWTPEDGSNATFRMQAAV